VPPSGVSTDFLGIFSRGGRTQAEDRPFYFIDDDRSMPSPARDINDTIFSNNMFFVFKPELDFRVKIKGVFNITSKKSNIFVTIMTVGLGGFIFVNRTGDPDALEIESFFHVPVIDAHQGYTGEATFGV